MRSKSEKKRLALKRETLRSLTKIQLTRVQGGADWYYDGGGVEEDGYGGTTHMEDRLGIKDTRFCGTR